MQDGCIRGTPISFTLPELFNALGSFRAWSIERRREPFFLPELRSYIPRHAWWWASCMLRWFFYKRKLANKTRKGQRTGTDVSWVLRPSETNTISKCPSATKSLQTWGRVSHYNIFHQPLEIMESILIRGEPLLFVTSFLVLDKTTCFFPFWDHRNRAQEGHRGSWKKHPAKLLQLELKKIGQLEKDAPGFPFQSKGFQPVSGRFFRFMFFFHLFFAPKKSSIVAS